MPSLDIFAKNIPEHGLVENPKKGDTLYGIYVNDSRTPVVTYFSQAIALLNARHISDLLELQLRVDFVVTRVRELKVIRHDGTTIHVKEGDQIFDMEALTK